MHRRPKSFLEFLLFKEKKKGSQVDGLKKLSKNGFLFVYIIETKLYLKEEL
jgi:hypothetical protein